MSETLLVVDDDPLQQGDVQRGGGVARQRMLHASNTIRNTIEKGNTYCYKNIDYDNEIRVLKVYPGLPGSAIICCLLPCPLVDQTLQPALPSSIPYAALSYCWGSDEAVNKIYFLETDKVYTEWKGPNKNALDGMVRTKMVSCLLVGSSLKDALETLRSRSKEAVFLWADALCINQKNLVERTAQVSRMHDVYTQAETVYIWLGTGKDEGKAEDPGKGKDEAKRDNTGKDQDEKNRKTLAFLTKILDLHELEMVVKRLEEREANANWLEDKQDCKRTIELMGAQWFSRRWVIQELALARSASVLFGNCEMPWRDFADAIALFMTKFDQIKAAFPAPKNYAALRTSEDRYINSLDAKALGANVLVTATSNLFRKSSSGRIIQRLLSLELLVSSMLLAFEATDPRDTVFAVLQIAKDISPRNFSPHRHSIIFRRSAAETLSYTVPILGIILWTLYDNSLTLTGDYKGPTTDIALTNMALGVLDARNSLPVFVVYCTLLSLSMFIVWLLGRMLIKPVVIGLQIQKGLDSRIEANYRKCLKDVCADFIEYCIENSNSLDIICRHWAPLPKPPAKVDMPSWILPISGNAFGGPAQAKKGRVHGDSFVGSEKGGFYTASGSRTPVFKFGKTKTAGKPIADEKMEKPGEFSKRDVQQREFPARFDGILKVKGFQLSEVEQSERIIGPVISREALKLCGWSKNRGASEADLDQVWRILVANRGPNGINPPDWYRRACSACLEWYNRLEEDKFNIDDLKTMEDTPKGKVEFLERVRQVVFDRSIIRAGSSQGKSYLGVAPPQAQRGDVVCILFG